MGHRLGSIDRIEFAGSVVQVMIDRVLGQTENLGDFNRCLAHGSPYQALAFALGQRRVGFCRLGRNLTQFLVHQMPVKSQLSHLMLSGKRLPRKNTAAVP